MDDYKEIIKNRLAELTPELRDFVLSDNWRVALKSIASKFNLSDEQYAPFENEVFFVLICLEPYEDFAENLNAEIGIDANVSSWIAEDVEKEIFDPVLTEIQAVWENTKSESEENGGDEDANAEKNNYEDENFTENQSSGVGQSFEKIMANQIKAMRPIPGPDNLPTEDLQETQQKAEESQFGQNTFGNQPINVSSNQNQKPVEENLKAENPAIEKDHYVGQDPYREPLE